MAENVLLRDVMTLRRALEDKKLVIFVGGGVSVNSDLPTWRELVMNFAKEIDYYYNENKTMLELTSDDLLKIPQYVYDLNPKRYAEIIEETMKVEMPANEINEKILEILPNHIITTNYDNLFENASDPNLSQYHIISSDSHLLTNSGEHYIIKMHGDIDELDKIVLKESDYLNYSNQRILIETFIKSLLVDHTFLFVGYSLSDFNLKQIMTWVEYLSDKENVSENRHHNFTFQTSEIKHFERTYWEKKNLFIIDSDSLPDALIEKYSASGLSLKDGQLLYAFLCLLLDESSDLEIEENAALMVDRYEAYDPVNYINAYDLLERSMITEYHYDAGSLIIHQEEMFERWERLLSNEEIQRYWAKSGIRRMQFPESTKSVEIALNQDLVKENNYLTKLILFDYRSLAADLAASDLQPDRTFYYKDQLNPSGEVTFNHQQNTNWGTLLSRYNSFLYHRRHQSRDSLKTEMRRYIDVMSPYEKKVYHYLYSLLEQGENLKRKEHLAELLSEVEQDYLLPSNRNNQPERAFNHLKSQVYEHFWFIKRNGILLDQDPDTQYNFQYYIKALLVTSYEWETLDVHLFVRYGSYEDSFAYINHTISFSNDVDFAKIAVNFFDSILYTLENQDDHLAENFSNFSLLIQLADVSASKKSEILANVIRLIANETFREYSLKHYLLEEVIQLVISLMASEVTLDLDDFILLVKQLPLSVFQSRKVQKIAIAIQQQQVQFNIGQLVERWPEFEATFQEDSDKLLLVSNLLPILPTTILHHYQSLFEANLDRLDLSLLIHLSERKLVNPANISQTNWLKRIEEALHFTQKRLPDSRDTLEVLIEECVILFLNDIFEDLSFLNYFIAYSAFLQYFLDAEHFDFSKIDLKHPLWIKIFNIKSIGQLF